MTKHEAIEILEEVKTLDDSIFTYSQAYNDALDMAIDALKAQEQEPRVMTLEEAKSAFVIEYKSRKLKEAGMTILDLDVDPTNAYYGELYRVWTFRPTDEQREAIPWN